ncbi:ATPase [Trypanosoma cruzi]|uniref:ATPase n=1 Tax=Trypanosoma cruzi TaxID=5693 RepID=A0A7J6YF29_TRYCR|nr:ATPase [Trypanosoma cruzi]
MNVIAAFRGATTERHPSFTQWILLIPFFFSFCFPCFFFFFANHFPSFACCFRTITMDVFFFFSTLLIVSCCTLPARGTVCFPPNCSTRTPIDTLMTTALCASPAARMRRGRDERRAEGAVTCGRATRACGAEHTFLSLLFCFFCGQGGQKPAAPHTQPRPAGFWGFFCFLCAFYALAVPSAFLFPLMIFLFFCCAHSPDGETRLPSCLRASLIFPTQTYG